MGQWMVKGCMLVFLLWNGILDVRRQEVSLKSFWIFGIAGIVLNLWLRYQTWWELLGGMGVGVFLVAAAFLTREAVGCGDGLLVCVTGLYLGMWENISLLLGGTAVCALVMALGLMLGKVRRKDRFPLVPFLLLVYAGRLLV